MVHQSEYRRARSPSLSPPISDTGGANTCCTVGGQQGLVEVGGWLIGVLELEGGARYEMRATDAWRRIVHTSSTAGHTCMLTGPCVPSMGQSSCHGLLSLVLSKARSASYLKEVPQGVAHVREDARDVGVASHLSMQGPVVALPPHRPR